MGATVSALGVAATGSADIAADRSITARLETAPFDPTRIVVLLPETTREEVDVAAIGQVAVSTDVAFAAETETLTLSDIVLDAFETQLTGTVTRQDAGQRLTGNIAVAALNANRLAAVLGDAFPDAVSPAALGSIALNTSFDYGRDARTLALDDFDARAADVDLSGAIRVSDVGGSPTWVGDIEVPPFDPEALLSRLERPLSARRDATTLSRASGSAHIEGNASRISAPESPSRARRQHDLRRRDDYAFQPHGVRIRFGDRSARCRSLSAAGRRAAAGRRRPPPPRTSRCRPSRCGD